MRTLFMSALVVPALGFAQPQYELVDLVGLYGNSFSPVSIGEDGSILGNAGGMACLASKGTLTFLPTYQGREWEAVAFASSGDVVGFDRGTATSLLYTGGKLINLGLPGWYYTPSAYAVNNVGQVTGSASNTAFIWEAGKVTWLPAPGAAIGRAILDSGQVVGFTYSGDDHAATWVDGQYMDINPSWARSSQAVAINEKGEIVGEARRKGAPTQGAVIWRQGKAYELAPTEIGDASDINNHSQVVGWSTPAGGGFTAFVWDDGDFYRLEDLILTQHGYNSIMLAHSINNTGQILAYGHTLNGDRPILLNPVPEPKSFAALAISLAFIKICRHSSRKRYKRQSTTC